MAQQNINNGTPNGNDGDFVRDAFIKTQANFTELYDSLRRQTVLPVFNNMWSSITFRGISAITADPSTITYDRSVIMFRTNTTDRYIAIVNSGTPVSQFRNEILNGDGRTFWLTINGEVSVAGNYRFDIKYYICNFCKCSSNFNRSAFFIYRVRITNYFWTT